jgi:hypothetical protein
MTSANHHDEHGETMEALAARLAGDPEPLPAAAAAHLAACDRCRDEQAAHERLWRELGRLTEAVPSDDLRGRFDATLAAYRAGLSDLAEEGAGEPASGRPRRQPLAFGPRPRRQPLRFALRYGPALAALVAGVAIGLAFGLARARPPAPSESMAELRAEVRDLRQVLTLSLLQQQGSASARLEGVSLGAGLAAHDPAVLAALLDTLASDPSPNVRLAAVDALAGRAAEPGVQRRLGELLRVEASPLVQIALADTLLSADGGRARTLVAPLASDREVRPEVREFVRQRLANQT